MNQKNRRKRTVETTKIKILLRTNQRLEIRNQTRGTARMMTRILLKLMRISLLVMTSEVD